MAYHDQELVAAIRKQYPDGIIYRDIYTTLPTRDIYLAAKRNGMSSIDWLRSNGFTWKESGYIEPDMRAGDSDLSADATAEQLAVLILQNYALIGECMLNDGQELLLFNAAHQIFNKLLNGHTVDLIEQGVLVVETVLLLRDWRGGVAEDDGTTSLWEYIYMQYGFNPQSAPNVAVQYIHIFAKQSG